MKYCPDCGQPTRRLIPNGDNRERDVCGDCGGIFYKNPLVVAGCVAEWQGKILLCRRAIEPRAGFWTLPAGFFELGESAADAGVRETWEEARAEVTVQGLFSFVNVAHIGQVHMFYRAAMTSGAHQPGPESLETALVDEANIPWEYLAFPTVHLTLSRYFADRRAGAFQLHDVNIERDDWRRMGLRRDPPQPAQAAP